MELNLSLLTKYKKIGVAVSGGKDSQALLHFLKEKEKSLGFKIIALNVEHGIRGESSLLDSEFVKGYCKKLNVPLFSFSVKAKEYAKENGISEETSARKLRYEKFFELIEKKEIDVVATAHHREDQVESVLLNLLRGAGIKGLTGMSEIAHKGKIVRPMLHTSKESIEEYIKQKDIPFVTDESNFCDDYSRNYLRLNVLPIIKEKVPAVSENIIKTSILAKEDDEFLSSLATPLVNVKGDSGYILLGDIKKPIFVRATKLLFEKLGVFYDVEKRHIDALYDLFLKGESGKSIDLPFSFKGIIEYDRLTIYKGEEKSLKGENLPFKTGNIHFLGKTFKIEKREKFERGKGLYFDIEKVPSSACFKSREQGDYFKAFGGFTKSLSDYLTDKKVPRKDRDDLILLADGNRILAILGMEISFDIKVDENTQEIYYERRI